MPQAYSASQRYSPQQLASYQKPMERIQQGTFQGSVGGYGGVKMPTPGGGMQEMQYGTPQYDQAMQTLNGPQMQASVGGPANPLQQFNNPGAIMGRTASPFPNPAAARVQTGAPIENMQMQSRAAGAFQDPTGHQQGMAVSARGTMMPGLPQQGGLPAQARMARPDFSQRMDAMQQRNPALADHYQGRAMRVQDARQQMGFGQPAPHQQAMPARHPMQAQPMAPMQRMQQMMGQQQQMPNIMEMAQQRQQQMPQFGQQMGGQPQFGQQFGQAMGGQGGGHPLMQLMQQMGGAGGNPQVMQLLQQLMGGMRR